MTNAEDNQNTESAARADAERAFASFGSQVSPIVRERILREGLAVWREQGLISAEPWLFSVFWSSSVFGTLSVFGMSSVFWKSSFFEKSFSFC